MEYLIQEYGVYLKYFGGSSFRPTALGGKSPKTGELIEKRGDNGIMRGLASVAAFAIKTFLSDEVTAR